MPIDSNELGRRLRESRTACQLTQEAVAGHLGTSRSSIAQMELGNRAVTSLELDRLAYLYGRDIRDLLADEFEPGDTLAALFRADPTITESSEVIDKVRHCILLGREMTSLERLLDIRGDLLAVPTYPERPPRSSFEAVEQGSRVAGEERRRLGLDRGPVPDMAEIMEQQGVRTGLVDLPDDVSGLGLTTPGIGSFIVANRRHHRVRRRFSFAHEYAHVLMDRERPGTISRESDRKGLIEVRANSFAASFLLPGAGVEHFVSTLGKGRPKRARIELFDGQGAHTVEGRAAPRSQDLQLHDVVQLAAAFDVSVQTACYRLKNLRLLTQGELDELLSEDRAGKSRTIQAVLGLGEHDHGRERDEFKRRFIGLALEAFRRDLISTGKLRELARLVDTPAEHLEALIEHTGGGS